jgi:CDP-6-deoxy-D-xylo-4-hexulose-3-dehydrase
MIDKNFEKKILNIIEDYKENYIDKKEESEFIPGVTSIPVSGKVLGHEEISLMIQSSLDAWLTTGKFNKQFEKQLAEFIGVKSLMTVNSGSSANLVAVSSLFSPKLKDKSIKKGDEIITVAAGFPTTINPIIINGAVPVFVDVNSETYNININLIEKAITKKTKAIVLAHTLGNPFDVGKVLEICKKYNLWLVEDCCDALGSTYDGKKVGNFGDLATLSFYPAHHITMGEGGAVFTNSIKLKRIAESIRDWGRDCYCEPGFDNTCKKRFDWKLGDLPHGYDHKYTYSHLGYNLKITDMQAACGLGQLSKLEKFILKRKHNFNMIFKRLKKLEEYIILPKKTQNSDPSWFGFPITIKNKDMFSRNEIVKNLNLKKIGTRLLFSGNITLQPYMKGLNFRVSGDLKNTNVILNSTFWIGVYPGISEKMIDYMCDVIEEYILKNKR